MEYAQPETGTLPPLREDVRLMGRSKDVSGQAVWLVFDPLRNRYLELRPVAYEILSRWKLGTFEALLKALKAETPYHIDGRDLAQFVAYLQQNQLLRRRSSPKTQQDSGSAVRLKKLLTSLVFFRVRLVRPDKILAVLADALGVFFSTWFWALTALAGVTGLMFVGRQWDEFTNTFAGFMDLQGLTVLVLAIVFSKIVHELGHALTAKRSGCRVPVMGLAFILGMPLAYTDVGDTWRLKSRRERFWVSAGGILAETVLAVYATWGWLILPDGPARTACFVLATTGWVGTLAINLNPFMRFDGYYLLSDALGVRNLQTRSFAMGKWGLRRFLWGWPGRAPEEVSRRFRRFLIGFAWLTWIVRAIVFAGIAVLAYVMFGKTFGTFIAAVEVGLFLFAPVYKEVGEWIKERRRWIGQKRAQRMLALMGVVLAFLLIPQSFRLSMPGVLAPHERVVVHAPQAAVVMEYPDIQRDVTRGETILKLTHPQLQRDMEQSHRKLQVVELALQQAAISQAAARQLNVFAEELAEEQARLDGQLAQQARLTMTAPFDGRITDIDPALSAGMWVNPDQTLFLLVSEQSATLSAYVDDRDRGLIQPGREVKFYPEATEYPILNGVITGIESVPLDNLEEPLLASINGGDIPVREDAAKALVPEHGLYQVSIQLTDFEDYSAIGHVLRGRVYADSEPYSLAGYAFDRIRALFSREAGY